MTKLPLPLSAVISTVVSLLIFFSAVSDALSSGDTIAGTSSAICGLVTDPSQTITCHVITLPNQKPLRLFSNVTFAAVSGGDSFLCGLRSGGDSIVCWDHLSSPNSTLAVKPHRLYSSTGPSPNLRSISVGESHVCAIRADTSAVICWQRYGRGFSPPAASEEFESISSGSGFTCGILKSTSRVKCWGYDPIRTTIESGFGNATVLSLVSGGSHACGITTGGLILCKGANDSAQLNAPIGSPFEFNQLSLGGDHGCAIRAENGSVVCWGGGGGAGKFSSGNVSFELVVSGKNFSCGLTTLNFSVVCWGPKFSVSGVAAVPIPLPEILPGQCISANSCGNCTTYPRSQNLCSGEGTRICKPCFNRGNTNIPSPPPQSLIPVPVPAEKKGLRRGLLAFAIVGSVGGLAGIVTAVYCLYTGVCFGKKKIHSSVQPTITRAPSSTTTSGSPPPSLIRRNGSRIMKRQRSGTSSKHADRAEEFTLAELASATAGFSSENRIGSGSFGVVYRGKLPDGRQVAIKRGDPQKKQQRHREKESAFESELSFLSRLHHKHLVRLIGFCDENDERLLVYEYMKNGALFDHLHGNNPNADLALNDWKMRIKVALDAARGIEYLHTYAVPPIIHRDIKSSNILLDATWTAKVSDFGLSMMGPGSGSAQDESSAIRPVAKAAGTVGYIDPEYYGLNVLTAKSDVYGLGVVLLELLTGKRAIFKDGEGTATSVVDYAVPAIMAGEIVKVLDPRPGPPELNEGEAVELVAYTAMHCVNLEGRERPTMTDIVANLERALGLCDHSHGSISSGILSIRSE